MTPSRLPSPSRCVSDAVITTPIIEGDHFRLLNEDGNVQFSGYILGEYTGREPLEDYGRANGCTAIEYEHEGSWVSPESFAELRR